MKIKRIVASILMVSILWASVITPAKAFLPLIALAVEAAYADVTMTTAIGISSAAIGTLIAFVKLKDPSSDNVMVVQLNPKAPLETPGGWSPPTTTVYPNAPSGIAASYKYTANSTDYPTEAEAQRNVVSNSVCNMNTGGYCQGGTINITSRTTTSNPDIYKITGTIAKTNPADGTVYNFTNLSYAGSYYCNAGYTIAGTYPSQICNVTNNAIVKKPAMGRDMYVRSGNTVSRDTQQATTDNMSTNSRAATVTTNSVKATNPATGATTTITINTDGTTTVVTTSPNADGNTSTVKTTYMSSPESTTGNVYVTGQKSETVTGQGAAVGTSSTPGATTPVMVDTSALESKVDAAASQAHSDSVAEQAKIDDLKNAQCGGTGQPACKIDESGIPSTVPQSQTDLATSMSTYAADAAAGIDGYAAPTSAPAESPLSNLQGGTCAPVVTGGWGVVPSMSLDTCPVVEALRPLVEWMLYILAALYLWFRFNSVQSGVSE